jgi:DNA-binding MarR family transcriptional regulator
VAGARKPESGSINFHLHTLASSLFKGATRYYTARFGVGLPEMRILSHLGSKGALPAYSLVELTAMDKAIVSRILATLARRLYIAPTAPNGDPRRRIWELTKSGRELVSSLRPVWRDREAMIQAGLSEEEQGQLVSMLKRMFEASERLRETEAVELSQQRHRKPAVNSVPLPIDAVAATANGAGKATPKRPRKADGTLRARSTE